MILLFHRPSLAPIHSPKWRAPSSLSDLNGLSRHSSRQNGESGGPQRRISGYPAVFPAILRDFPVARVGNKKSCHFSCQNGRNRTQSGQESGHRVRITHQPADLSAAVPQSGTKVEARETDKAFRKILKQVGVYPRITRMGTDEKFTLSRSGLPGGCAQYRHSKPLEFEGFRKLSDLNSYNLNFNPVEFDGFSLNAIAIRQMRTLTARNLQQLEGGAS